MKRYPVHVTLCFLTEDDRDTVMGQLSDGWGENHVTLDWPKDVLFADAEFFNVEPTDES
jgi:hypothetical protein